MPKSIKPDQLKLCFVSIPFCVCGYVVICRCHDQRENWKRVTSPMGANMQLYPCLGSIALAIAGWKVFGSRICSSSNRKLRQRFVGLSITDQTTKCFGLQPLFIYNRDNIQKTGIFDLVVITHYHLIPSTVCNTHGKAFISCL